MSNGNHTMLPAGEFERLCVRIAALEAENRRLREALQGCRQFVIDGQEDADLLLIIDTARADALEEAALWYDQREHDTPDVFETELHQISAAAIRALAKTPGDKT